MMPWEGHSIASIVFLPKNKLPGTSLMVKGWRLHFPMQGTHSIPGQGTEIPHTMQRGQKKLKHNLNWTVRKHQTNPNWTTFCKSGLHFSKLLSSGATKAGWRAIQTEGEWSDQATQNNIWPWVKSRRRKITKRDSFRTTDENWMRAMY